MIHPEAGLASMRRNAAEIRRRLNKVDQILAVIDDGERLDFKELADVSTESYQIWLDADYLNRYAQTLASASALGELAPLRKAAA